jgi:hypothetical protein
VSRRGPPGRRPPAQTTLAVLPFQNLAATPRIDHLRLALPDEIATTLSYIPALADPPVRVDAEVRERRRRPARPRPGAERVADVLTGHFQKEATSSASRWRSSTRRTPLLWRDTTSAAATT